MTQAITVLIVDDHQLVREGVRTFLQKQGDITVVGEAASGQEGLRLAADLVPDVVLMDLVMPEMDGVETTRRLKQISPGSQVIVLTSFDDDQHILPAIRAGALSYILKDVGTAALADTVRKAAIGEVVMTPQVAARVMRELRQGPAQRAIQLRTERARGRGAPADRGGLLQYGDCGATGHQRTHGQAPCQQYFEQAASGRPDAGRRLCLARGHGGQDR